MKKTLGIVAVLAIASVAWADMGNVVGDEAYHNDWGYRDWQAYESNFEMADLYWNLSSTNEVSLRYTPGTTVQFNAIRLGWAGGGSSTGASRNVSVWVESSMSSGPNYHPTAVDPAYNPTAWEIPSGAMVSPLVGVMPVQAAGMVVDFFVGQTTLFAGQTYHIRISAAPNATAQADKLRLLTGNTHLNKTFEPVGNNYNGNTNYRNADGVCGCKWTPSTTANGDDCMAVLWKKDIIDPFGDPMPYDRWTEGQIWNDGIEDYAKYQEPRFELLDYDYPLGVGQGTDARTPITVTPAWYGEKFVLQPTGAGCSPPEPNPPEQIVRLYMYVKKATGEQANLDIALMDGAGNPMAMGTRTAASIPDFYEIAADGVTPCTDWGWVGVDIPPTMLMPGATYIVAAASAGVGYQILQQDFNKGGLEINSTAASYQGAVGRAWNGADILNSDVLFLISPVPEPATMALLALGGLGVLLKRRRS